MAVGALVHHRDDPVVAAARAVAEAVELRAGVTVRELSAIADLGAVSLLLRSIWGSSDDTGPPLNRDILRALTDAGNYVAGASDADRRLRGALVAFLGHHQDGRHLHSHILGVAAAGTGQGTGFALKLHQRAWALERGHDVIEWTFDPLVRRNAFFNLTKLGGQLHRYHVDFYGAMTDLQNGADPSDRVRVRWQLRSERVVSAAAGAPAAPLAQHEREGAHVAVATGARGEPVPAATPVRAPILLVHTPDDIVELRRHQPALASAWRAAVRDALAGALDAGYRCAGVTRAGEYVLRRQHV